MRKANSKDSNNNRIYKCRKNKLKKFRVNLLVVNAITPESFCSNVIKHAMTQTEMFYNKRWNRIMKPENIFPVRFLYSKSDSIFTLDHHQHVRSRTVSMCLLHVIKIGSSVNEFIHIPEGSDKAIRPKAICVCRVSWNFFVVLREGKQSTRNF